MGSIIVMVRVKVKNRIGRSQSHEEAAERAGVKAEVCPEAGVTWGSESRLELDWDQS